MPSWSNRVVFSVVFLGVLPVAAVLHWAYLPYAEDDAYIHMRIARHLFLAKTPFFNLGDRVNASTSPAWILLTSPFAALGRQQPLAVSALNAIVTALACACWTLLFRLLSGVASPVVTIAAAITTFFTILPSSVGLMETPLAILAVGASFALLFTGNTWWVLPAMVAPFVRPECAAFLPALAIARARRGRPMLTEVVLGALTLAPLLYFQLSFFGSVWPHTATAKAIVYRINPEEFVRLLFYGAYGEFVTKAIVPAVTVGLVIGICGLVLTNNRMRMPLRSGWLLLVVPAVAIVGAYAANKVLVFSWYPGLFLVPLHLALLAAAAMSPLGISSIALLSLVPLASQAVLFVVGAFDPPRAPNFQNGTRAMRLVEIGRELYGAYPNAKVLAPEIGGLGFSFEGDIIDAVGLVTPEALRFHPMRVPEQRSAGFLGAVPAALVAETKPTLIVGLAPLLEEVLASDLLHDYRRYDLSPLAAADRARWPNAKVWGNVTLVLLVRRDAPEPPAGL